MTTTRTDAHRPSSTDFDPEQYSCCGVFDLRPGEGSFNFDHAERIATVNRLLDQGYRFAAHQNSGQCGHCGAALRYVALMAREDMHEMIYVGETCLSNRFEDLTKAQFQNLRKQAQLDREKHARLAAFDQFLVDHPELTPATYAYNLVFDVEQGEFAHEKFGTGWATSVIADILSKLRQYGSISDKQIAFVVKLIGEIEEKISNYVEPIPAGPAPRGKQTIEGEIVGFKVVDGFTYNSSVTKMVVVLANGSKVYGTVPMVLSAAEKGDRVQFTATFEAPKNADDPSFAFFKRPTQASIIH